MNINSNNMRGFSQYSLLNKLFSQKNGNKTSTFNQMGSAISGALSIAISIIMKMVCHSIQRKKPTDVSKG